MGIFLADSKDLLYFAAKYMSFAEKAVLPPSLRKILDHSGIVWNCWTGALAYLGVFGAIRLNLHFVSGFRNICF